MLFLSKNLWKWNELIGNNVLKVYQDEEMENFGLNEFFFFTVIWRSFATCRLKYELRKWIGKIDSRILLKFSQDNLNDCQLATYNLF